MTTEWYYGTNDERHGPIALDDLQQLVASGEVKATDLAWSDGFYDWKPVGQVSQLNQTGGNRATASFPQHGKQSVEVAPESSATPGSALSWVAWTAIVFLVLELVDKLMVAIVAISAGQMSASFILGMVVAVVRNGVLCVVALSLTGVTQKYLGFRFGRGRGSKIGFGVVGAVAILYLVVREYDQLTQWYAIVGYQIALAANIVQVAAIIAGVYGLLKFGSDQKLNKAFVSIALCGLTLYAVLSSVSLVIGLSDGTLGVTWQLARNVFAIVQAAATAVVVWKVIQLHWNESQHSSATSNRQRVRTQTSPTEGLKGWLNSLWSNTQAAGQLVVKQAEKTKLTTVTLPAVCRELGRHVYDEGRLRSGLTSNFEVIDRLNSEIAQLAEKPADADAPQVISEKVKALASSAKRTAQRKVIEQKLAPAYAGLGKTAFEQHGEACGPGNLVSNVTEHQTRLGTLDAEITELSQAGQGQVLTPKRIAIGGVTVAALLLLLVLKALFLPAGPIYAHLESDYRGMVESYKARLLEEHGVDEFDQVPRSASRAAFEKLQKEVDVLFADTKPPAFTIDESAASIISELSVSPPEYDSMIFGSFWTFPLKVTAKSRISRWDTKLIYKVYAPDDTVLDDGEINFDTDGVAGEKLSGNTSAVMQKSFFKAHHYRIFKKE
jgi:hypothetical protein